MSIKISIDFNKIIVSYPCFKFIFKKILSVSKALNTNIISISKYRYPSPFAKGFEQPSHTLPHKFLAMIFQQLPPLRGQLIVRRVEVRKWRSFAVSVSVAVDSDAGTKRVKRQLSAVIWPASVQQSARQRQSE